MYAVQRRTNMRGDWKNFCRVVNQHASLTIQLCPSRHRDAGRCTDFSLPPPLHILIPCKTNTYGLCRANTTISAIADVVWGVSVVKNRDKYLRKASCTNFVYVVCMHVWLLSTKCGVNVLCFSVPVELAVV